MPLQIGIPEPAAMTIQEAIGWFACHEEVQSTINHVPHVGVAGWAQFIPRPEIL